MLSSPVWIGFKAIASPDSNASTPTSGNSRSQVVEAEHSAQPAPSSKSLSEALLNPEAQNTALQSLPPASPRPEWWSIPESSSSYPVAPVGTAASAGKSKGNLAGDTNLATKRTTLEHTTLEGNQVQIRSFPSGSILLQKLKKSSGNSADSAIAQVPQPVSAALDLAPNTYTADALTSPGTLQFSPAQVNDLNESTGSQQLQSQPQSLEKSQQNTQSTQTTEDPELGVLRLQELPCRDFDPELGCLRLREAAPPPAPPPAKYVYLFARLDYFRSSNIYSALDPVEDGLVRPGLTLYATPPLGPNTYLALAVDGNLIRYSTQTQINYNELNLRAGILQRLSPVMYGEIGWGYQQLFTSGNQIPGFPSGTRFLNDHGIRFELNRRDQLSPKLSLTTYYQFRYGFADPDSRSRMLNSLFTSLSFQIQPTLQVGLDYQFYLANFTHIDREDQYHQLVARLTYNAFRNTQFNLFAGYSFGHSSDPTVNFDGLILGVNMTLTFGLF